MADKEEKNQDIKVTDSESVRILKAYEKEFGPVEEKPFPGGDFRPFAREFRVYFDKHVYKDIIDHSYEDNRVELGGVLIGEIRKDKHGGYLHVIANIRGKYSTSSISQITFTQDTWNHINAIKDKEYADKKIMGWYHTHPGFGIFLSDMDIFIHENFFGSPYQIALVVDPKNGTEGCFIRKDGKITLLERFWVKKDEHKCVQDKSEKELLFDRLEKIEKRLKEYADKLPELEESRGGSFSFYGMMGWMLAIFLLIILLLQNFGVLGKRVGENARSNEVLVRVFNDEKQKLSFRLYVAPMDDKYMILPSAPQLVEIDLTGKPIHVPNGLSPGIPTNSPSPTETISPMTSPTHSGAVSPYHSPGSSTSTPVLSSPEITGSPSTNGYPTITPTKSSIPSATPSPSTTGNKT